MTYNRVFVIVVDSLGIGALPDSGKFGDVGVNTLGHIAEKTDALIAHTCNTGTDVLGFGRQLRQKRHRWYQENAAQWPSCFRAAQIPIEVHVTLRRGGYLQ